MARRNAGGLARRREPRISLSFIRTTRLPFRHLPRKHAKVEARGARILYRDDSNALNALRLVATVSQSPDNTSNARRNLWPLRQRGSAHLNITPVQRRKHMDIR